MSPSEIVFQFLPPAQSPIISVCFVTSFAFKTALGSPTSQVLNTSSLLPRRTIAQSCSTGTLSRKDIVCIPLYVPAKNDSEWALECLVARVRFQRPVEGGFCHFTTTNAHIKPQVRWPTSHLHQLCAVDTQPVRQGVRASSSRVNSTRVRTGAKRTTSHQSKQCPPLPWFSGQHKARAPYGSQAARRGPSAAASAMYLTLKTGGGSRN